MEIIEYNEVNYNIQYLIEKHIIALDEKNFSDHYIYTLQQMGIYQHYLKNNFLMNIMST